jgi:hypothetical protein
MMSPFLLTLIASGVSLSRPNGAVGVSEYLWCNHIQESQVGLIASERVPCSEILNESTDPLYPPRNIRSSAKVGMYSWCSVPQIN